MLTQFTNVFSSEGINIDHMTNKSRDKFAYTLLDLETRVEEITIQKLNAIKGVCRVRVVK